uniref:Uncharacterized protein n=1 Tax=Romanomermis culicivorax TaxID=13658 RepID=A0A915KR37_ROMCU
MLYRRASNCRAPRYSPPLSTIATILLWIKFLCKTPEMLVQKDKIFTHDERLKYAKLYKNYTIFTHDESLKQAELYKNYTEDNASSAPLRRGTMSAILAKSTVPRATRLAAMAFRKL